MLYPSLDKLVNQMGSKYTLVTCVARRARSLIDGQPSLVEVSSTKPVTMALAEVEGGKLHCERPSLSIK